MEANTINIGLSWNGVLPDMMHGTRGTPGAGLWDGESTDLGPGSKGWTVFLKTLKIVKLTKIHLLLIITTCQQFGDKTSKQLLPLLLSFNYTFNYVFSIYLIIYIHTYVYITYICFKLAYFNYLSFNKSCVYIYVNNQSDYVFGKSPVIQLAWHRWTLQKICFLIN